MQVSLLFPPTWHPSQPYLSLPSLTGFLAQGSIITISQCDLGIELLDGMAPQPYGTGIYWETESSRRIKYRVIGDLVYVLIRLCSLAGKSAILLSAAFHATIGFLSPHELLSAMQFKGKGQALPVFRVKR
jgi:hypothetical protein